MGVIQLNLDGRPVEVREDAQTAWLDSGVPRFPEMFRRDLFLPEVDPNRPLNWSELDKLKDLRQIYYAGRDGGVERYVAGRHQILGLE